MSNGQSVLGIQVEAKGVNEAAERLAGITDDLKAIEKETAQASEASRKLAEANEKAFKDTADAVMSLGQAENALWAEQEKMQGKLEAIAAQIESMPDQLPFADPEQADELEDYIDELEIVKDNIETVSKVTEALISGIKDFGSAMLEAYKPLEDARAKLKFFQNDAKDTEQTLAYLSQAANDWGQSTTTLTQAATILAKSDIDIQSNLEAIVKLSSASRNDLTATAEIFAKAIQGDESALKTLKEEYKLSTEQLKQYGVSIDDAGKITAETADQQKKLAEALTNLTNIQYDTAITEQQETLAGAIQSLENSIERAKQSFGEALAPVVSKIANILTVLVDSFNKLPPSVQKGVVGITVLAGTVAGLLATLAQLTASLAGAVVAIRSYGIISLTASAQVASANAATMTWAETLSVLNTRLKTLATLNPVGVIVAITYAVGDLANELIKLYDAEQKALGDELTKESKVDTAYNTAIREMNVILQKAGVSLDALNDKAKKDALTKYLSKNKDEAEKFSKLLDQIQPKLDQEQKKLEDNNKEIERRQQALKDLETGNNNNLDYYNAKISRDGLFGYGGLGKDETYGKELDALKQQSAEYTKNNAEISKRADLVRDTVNSLKEIADLEKKEKEHLAEVKKAEQEREKAQKEKANTLKEQLATILEQARGLSADDAGINKTRDTLTAYKQIGDANAYIIQGQKDLNKTYDQGLSALEKQLAKLEAQKKATEQKAEAEKIFSEQSQKQESLKGKSLEEQKAGLDEILSRYKDLLSADSVLSQNAENRKKAEAEIRKITAERLDLEEKIANMQKDASEKLKDAQMKAAEQTLKRMEAEKEHLEKMGKTTEAQRKQAEIDAQRQRINQQKEANDIEAINKKYEPLLKEAKGNDAATRTYQQARAQEIANVKDTYAQQRINETWQQQEAIAEKAKQTQEALNTGKQQETTQAVKASDSLDKLSKSADKASASLDKSTQKQDNIHEYGGIKAKVQSGKPVEILETPETYKPNQTWEWTPSYEMIKAIDQIKGINLPSVGTPLPREMFSRGASQQLNQNTYNVSVNGIPTANQTVDSRQIALHAANLAEQNITQKISQSTGLLNYG